MKKREVFNKQIHLAQYENLHMCNNFFLLAHRHSWQVNPEPVTGFVQCGLSLFIRLEKEPPSCSAPTLILVAFVPKAFSDVIFLVTMDFSVNSFLFRSFRFFSIFIYAETVVVCVDPHCFLFLGVEPLKTDDRGRQNLWGQYSPIKPDAETHNDSWDLP